MITGVGLVCTAKTIGGCIGFGLGKTLLHEYVKSKLIQTNDKFAVLFANIGTDSFKVALLLRLSPIPSWVNSYGLALTPISFSSFFWVSA